MSENILMQGNEACINGAIRAGLKFYAGYPITPSTEILETASYKLPMVGGKFIQMEDELASIAAVIGASLCGLKSMTATSGPGFSLMQENIGYASMAEIPCVIVNVMRGGPSTGLPTSVSQGDVMQAKWGTHGDHPVIVIAPTNVREIYYLTIKAFNYAEEYRTPVILLMDEVIAHMRESVLLNKNVIIYNRKKPDGENMYRPYKYTEDLIPSMASIGEGYNFHVTGLVHDEYGYPSNLPEDASKLIRRLQDKIQKNIKRIVLYDYIDKKSDELMIAYGSTARVCKEIIQNKDINLFIPHTIWPFPEEELLSIIKSSGIKRIYVPEMNCGQLVQEIRRIVSGKCDVFSIPKFSGELFSPDEICHGIKEALI